MAKLGGIGDGVKQANGIDGMECVTLRSIYFWMAFVMDISYWYYGFSAPVIVFVLVLCKLSLA